MRQVRAILTAAVLSVGGVAFAADPVTITPGGTQADPSMTVTTPGGQMQTDMKTTEIRSDRDVSNAAVAAPDANDIRKTIAWVTETAVTKGDFEKLQKRFVDADATRLGKYKSADNFAQLDGRVDQFNKDWKAKYNEDFKLENVRNDVLNDQFARIVQGEIGEARTASNKEVLSAEPQNVKGGTADDLKKSGVNQPDPNSNKTFGGNTNREPGRNVATVIIPGSAQASMNLQPGQAPSLQTNAQKEIDVALIHELPDTWKIDVPDNIDGGRLYDNLLKHITMVDEDRANWPADKNEAYRAVTRHVMAALTESGS